MWIALSCPGRVVPARDKAVGLLSPSWPEFMKSNAVTESLVAQGVKHLRWCGLSWLVHLLRDERVAGLWAEVSAGTMAELPVHRQPEWEVSFFGLILLVPTGLKGWISSCWDVELLLGADCSVTSFCLLWTPCLTVNILTNTGNADFLFCYIAETFYVVHIVLMEHGLFFKATYNTHFCVCILIGVNKTATSMLFFKLQTVVSHLS